jgi:hypothetical protein
MKIGIIGSGVVAQALGAGFLKHGYDVVMGTRHPEKLKAWKASNPAARIATFAEAATAGEIVVLAVKGAAALDALREVGIAAITGKVVIDTTNPIAEAPPDHGVLEYFTSLDESLMERLQHEYPAARFVKAFNSVGNAFMVNPSFKGGPPTMFICGNFAEAKGDVTRILEQFGWETVDLGSVEAARAIEPLCILWCIPGFLRNEWSHAFKLLRA